MMERMLLGGTKAVSAKPPYLVTTFSTSWLVKINDTGRACSPSAPQSLKERFEIQ